MGSFLLLSNVLDTKEDGVGGVFLLHGGDILEIWVLRFLCIINFKLTLNVADENV